MPQLLSQIEGMENMNRPDDRDVREEERLFYERQHAERRRLAGIVEKDASIKPWSAPAPAGETWRTRRPLL